MFSLVLSFPAMGSHSFIPLDLCLGPSVWDSVDQWWPPTLLLAAPLGGGITAPHCQVPDSAWGTYMREPSACVAPAAVCFWDGPTLAIKSPELLADGPRRRLSGPQVLSHLIHICRNLWMFCWEASGLPDKFLPGDWHGGTVEQQEGPGRGAAGTGCSSLTRGINLGKAGKHLGRAIASLKPGDWKCDPDRGTSLSSDQREADWLFCVF